MNTFRLAERTWVGQDKDGQTNTHKDGTNLEWLTPNSWRLCMTSTPTFQMCYITHPPHSPRVIHRNIIWQPIPVAARSKAWICGRSLAEIAVSNPAGAWMSVVNVLCCQVEVSARDRSLVQRSPTECACVCVCHWVCAGATISFYT
jgi:hypothetical protein